MSSILPPLPPKAEGIVQDARKKVTSIPPRLRFVIGLGLVLALCYYFSNSSSDVGLRPKSKSRHSYVPGLGGKWNNFDSIIAFGDSWSATQFYSGGVQPNAENPFGNPELPENGKSHPPNWLHYLTMNYNHTFLKTYNMAHGAATIDRNAVPPHENLNWTHTFREQVDEIFRVNYTLHKPDAFAQWEPEKTLFAIWFGVVDISLLIVRKEYEKDITAKMIDAYSEILDSIYEGGGRHFLLLTAPPMYLSPSAHEEGHNPFEERSLIRQFNGRLYATRKTFLQKHSDVTAYVFDTHGLMTKIIQDPSITEMTQHLKNTTDNCWDYNPDGYSDPKPWDWNLPQCFIPFDEYLWANHLHPTHVFHNATAAAIVGDCMSERRRNFCS